MRNSHKRVDGNVTEVSEQILEKYVRYEVLTELKTKIIVFYDVTL
jgi:hypothetical protein